MPSQMPHVLLMLNKLKKKKKKQFNENLICKNVRQNWDQNP